MSEELIEQGVHSYSEASRYVKPTEKLILDRLEWFQDQKLALMMHWGPYSQIGLVESWALSDADAEWSATEVDWEQDREAFRKQYIDLSRSFNPLRFMPEQWADFAWDCGFKYVILTTKHHDGFCMWDSAYSAYKITSPDCPFHSHPKADIVKHAFDAFRAKGMGIAAYFSKADWHIPCYWEHTKNTTRGPSYNPHDKSALWQDFKTFTQNQILELCKNYGKIDILWFDAGWVRPPKQDINIKEIVARAREIQPWLLSADRTCGGPSENYLTPEQCVPREPLGVPWESCVTAGTQFSYRFEDQYKPPRELVRLLADIVCKGGNLALNIGPQPDGRLPSRAMDTVRGMGAWLKRNGDAIYGTRTVIPHSSGPVRYTQKNGLVYAIVFCEKDQPLFGTVEIAVNPAWACNTARLLDTGEQIPFTRAGDKLKLKLPHNLSENIAQVIVLEK